jgi:hypothetical protein
MYLSRPDEEIADTINSRRGKELLGGQLRHNMTSNKKITCYGDQYEAYTKS